MNEPIPVTLDTLWNALKAECCVHPETAARCVMVNREDVKRALARLGGETK